MPFRLTSEAAKDIDGIVEYTLLNFGDNQADKYAASLTQCFNLIADIPTLGREYERRPGLRQFLHGRHVIFYRVDLDNVSIVRVLHERMNPDRLL